MSWLSAIVSWFVRRDPLVAAGERAAAEALRMWALDIYDPPVGSTSPAAARSLEVINDVIRRAGWGWIGTYKGNGPPQWCGLFAAACWHTAGIEPSWLATFWASTLRLAYWFTYRKWNEHSAGRRPELAPRMFVKVERDMKPDKIVFPDGTAPRAGDIVVVGDGMPAEGDHITVLIAFDAATGVFHTVSGNGGGIGPDGKRREGIVKTDYTVSAAHGCHVLWVYRPGESDVLAA